MARNIKYRKKEVKEARDLMGLAALVLASKESRITVSLIIITIKLFAVN